MTAEEARLRDRCLTIFHGGEDEAEVAEACGPIVPPRAEERFRPWFDLPLLPPKKFGDGK